MTTISPGYPAGASFILLTPLGKPLSLAAGETIQAQVVDVAPSGGVTLNIKGTFVPARTGLPLAKGDSILLRVAEHNAKTGMVNLQFLGNTPDGGGLTPAGPPSGGGLDAFRKLMDELSGVLSSRTIPGDTPPGGQNTSAQGSRGAAGTAPGPPDQDALQRVIVKLLKAFPAEGAMIPAEIRARLQGLLQASLKVSGETIRMKVETLMGNLPAAMKSSADKALCPDIPVTVEGPLASELKRAVEDTGVLLEAKLRGLSQSPGDPGRCSQDSPVQAGDAPPSAKHDRETPPASLRMRPESAGQDIRSDLKARLLGLKDAIAADAQGPSGKGLLKQLAVGLGFESEGGSSSHQSALRTIDGILCDIETYQLLSKATHSFHTFLPLQWENLRDGDISFRKKQRGSSKGVYSCRLNLDLERLGGLSAIVVMQNDTFAVSFSAEHPALCEALKSHIRSLEEAFLRKGLSLHSTRVTGADDRSFDELGAVWSVETELNMKV